MQILFMTPGSGDNFYCENCLRDKAAIMALRAAGYDAMSLPLYLHPRMQDTAPPTDVPIFFGGINVFLQQHLRFFRRTPRWLDKLFDNRWLLKLAARNADMTTPGELGRTALSMLQGEQGRQAKELERLTGYLTGTLSPDVIVLSNALLLGTAKRLKETLDCALVCMLQDEHEFVDSLPGEFPEQVWQLMRDRGRYVDMFVAGSRYYAELMQPRLDLPDDRIRVAAGGIDPEGYVPADVPPDPPTVGFLSRRYPEKGLDLLAEAFVRIKADPTLRDARLLIAGGSTGADKRFVRSVRRTLARAGVDGDVEWLDDFDHDAKRRFLPRLSVMCVPDRVGPASGIFVIESLLAGVPVVEPACGVLPELVEATGGGLLFEPENVDDMTAKLKALLADPDRAHALGRTGRRAAMEHFTAHAAAARLADVFRDVTRAAGDPSVTR